MIKFLCCLAALIFIAAGINHFVNADFYEGITPRYLPAISLLNVSSGILEIVFGTGLLFKATRKPAATGIVVLLLLFLMVHIDMLMQNCSPGRYCVSQGLLWLRLFLQPFLIWGIWVLRNREF